MKLIALVLLAQSKLLAGFPPYEAKLREVLQLPAFNEEAKGADFALRVMLLPSFHQECFVTVLRRGTGADAVVRCASSSVWYSMDEPSRKPVGVTERFSLSKSEIATLEALAPAIRSWKKRPEMGADGMTTFFELPDATLEWWHGATRDGPSQWVIALTNVLLGHAKTTRGQLESARSYIQKF